jgi:hypothetical protein
VALGAEGVGDPVIDHERNAALFVAVAAPQRSHRADVGAVLLVGFGNGWRTPNVQCERYPVVAPPFPVLALVARSRILDGN